jgi:hypothetical protein
LLTYLRYNQVIGKKELNDLKIKRFTDKDIDGLKEMSNAKNCKILFEIGQAAAKSDVREDDFPLEFDLN